MRNKSSLIVFLRYPEKGKVKTRLAATTSEEFAQQWYRKCVDKIMSEIDKIPNIETNIFYSDRKEKEKVIKWLGNKFIYHHQEGTDLGEKMQNAFFNVFSHNSGKVIIIGTDIPDLNQNILTNAFELLDKNDIVLGPSVDGGYYLLGMNRLHNSLFEGIEFSTSTVLSETISKIDKLGLTFSILPKLQDIDIEDDLIKWQNKVN
ncbi:MAG: TIGR04282 family arsenosugar biosynthesis glycosyltransferase [Ignavibacteriaceae bacterium]|nr:TIGR04282 family arsenosugar biosynthesis glycosyltransferase [Ignavibacteriaceae bacterium]